MERKEQEAADALAGALAALSAAILKCGDADLSFMTVIEPLMGAHECIQSIRNKLWNHPDCRDPAHPGCSQCRPTCRQCGAMSFTDAESKCIRISHSDCHGSELWPDGDD